MSLTGDRAAVMWHEVRPEAKADYYEWHNREHMPERVGMPGFRRGRRYMAVDGQPKFFILHETDSAATLTGAAYQLRLNNPTPLTRRNSALLMNASRSLCRVAASLGTAQGGFIACNTAAARCLALSDSKCSPEYTALLPGYEPAFVLWKQCQ